MLGTYGDRTGLANVSQCVPCPRGKYCGKPALDIWSGDCTAGYYCIQSAQSLTPNDGVTGIICPKGDLLRFFFLMPKSTIYSSNIFFSYLF